MSISSEKLGEGKYFSFDASGKLFRTDDKAKCKNIVDVAEKVCQDLKQGKMKLSHRDLVHLKECFEDRYKRSPIRHFFSFLRAERNARIADQLRSAVEAHAPGAEIFGQAYFTLKDGIIARTVTRAERSDMRQIVELLVKSSEEPKVDEKLTFGHLLYLKKLFDAWKTKSPKRYSSAEYSQADKKLTALLQARLEKTEQSSFLGVIEGYLEQHPAFQKMSRNVRSHLCAFVQTRISVQERSAFLDKIAQGDVDPLLDLCFSCMDVDKKVQKALAQPEVAAFYTLKYKEALKNPSDLVKGILSVVTKGSCSVLKLSQLRKSSQERFEVLKKKSPPLSNVESLERTLLYFLRAKMHFLSRRITKEIPFNQKWKEVVGYPFSVESQNLSGTEEGGSTAGLTEALYKELARFTVTQGVVPEFFTQNMPHFVARKGKNFIAVVLNGTRTSDEGMLQVGNPPFFIYKLEGGPGGRISPYDPKDLLARLFVLPFVMKTNVPDAAKLLEPEAIFPHALELKSQQRKRETKTAADKQIASEFAYLLQFAQKPFEGTDAKIIQLRALCAAYSLQSHSLLSSIASQLIQGIGQVDSCTVKLSKRECQIIFTLLQHTPQVLPILEKIVEPTREVSAQAPAPEASPSSSSTQAPAPHEAPVPQAPRPPAPAPESSASASSTQSPASAPHEAPVPQAPKPIPLVFLEEENKKLEQCKQALMAELPSDRGDVLALLAHKTSIGAYVRSPSDLVRASLESVLGTQLPATCSALYEKLIEYEKVKHANLMFQDDMKQELAARHKALSEADQKKLEAAKNRIETMIARMLPDRTQVLKEDKIPVMKGFQQIILNEILATYEKKPESSVDGNYKAITDAVNALRFDAKGIDVQRPLQLVETKLLDAIAQLHVHTGELMGLLTKDRSAQSLPLPALETLYVLYAQNNLEALSRWGIDVSQNQLKQKLEKQIYSVLCDKQQVQKAQRVIEKLSSLAKNKDQDSFDELKNDVLIQSKGMREYEVEGKNRGFLLFEVLNNIFMFKEQVTNIAILNSLDTSGHFQNVILQQLMGSGKSFVLIPLLALSRADGDNLSIAMMPDALLKTNLQDLQARLGEGFQQMVIEQPEVSADMTVQELQYLELLLQTVRERRGILLFSPEKMHVLLNTFTSLFESPEAKKVRDKIDGIDKKLQLLKAKKDPTQEDQKKISELEGRIKGIYDEFLTSDSTRDLGLKLQAVSSILQLFKEKGAVLGDEVDDLLKTSLQYIISIGEEEQVPIEDSELVGDLMLFVKEQAKSWGVGLDFLVDAGAQTPYLSKPEFDTRLVPHLALKAKDLLQAQLEKVREVGDKEKKRFSTIALGDSVEPKTRLSPEQIKTLKPSLEKCLQDIWTSIAKDDDRQAAALVQTYVAEQRSMPQEGIRSLIHEMLCLMSTTISQGKEAAESLTSLTDNLNNILLFLRRRQGNEERSDGTDGLNQLIDGLPKMLHDKICVLRKTIMQVFHSTLNSHCNEEYGILLGQKTAFAVPFIGPNSPAQTQFSSPQELVARTLAAYNKTGIPEFLLTLWDNDRPTVEVTPERMRAFGFIRFVWKNFRGDIEACLSEQQKKEVAALSEEDEKVSYLQSLTMNPSVKQGLLDKLRTSFTKKENEPAFRQFVKRFVYPLVKEHAESITSNSQKLFHAFRSFSGITGTFWNVTTMPKYDQTLPDARTVGESFMKLVEKTEVTSPQITVKSLGKKTEHKDKLLAEILSRSDRYALIDGGGWLRDAETLEFAKSILNEREDLKYVIFYDLSKKRVVLEKTKEGFKEPYPSTEDFEKDPSKQKERFTIYGQQYTVGVDIPQEKTANCVMTLGPRMIQRDFLQGIFRMRKILKNQQAVLVYDDEAKEALRVMLGKDSIDNPDFLDWMQFFAAQETVMCLDQNQQSTSERMDCHLEDLARSQIMDALARGDFRASFELFAAGREFFVTNKQNKKEHIPYPIPQEQKIKKDLEARKARFAALEKKGLTFDTTTLSKLVRMDELPRKTDSEDKPSVGQVVDQTIQQTLSAQALPSQLKAQVAGRAVSVARVQEKEDEQQARLEDLKRALPFVAVEKLLNYLQFEEKNKALNTSGDLEAFGKILDEILTKNVTSLFGLSRDEIDAIAEKYPNVGQKLLQRQQLSEIFTQREDLAQQYKDLVKSLGEAPSATQVARFEKSVKESIVDTYVRDLEETQKLVSEIEQCASETDKKNLQARQLLYAALEKLQKASTSEGERKDSRALLKQAQSLNQSAQKAYGTVEAVCLTMKKLGFVREAESVLPRAREIRSEGGGKEAQEKALQEFRSSCLKKISLSTLEELEHLVDLLSKEDPLKLKNKFEVAVQQRRKVISDAEELLTTLDQSKESMGRRKALSEIIEQMKGLNTQDQFQAAANRLANIRKTDLQIQEAKQQIVQRMQELALQGAGCRKLFDTAKNKLKSLSVKELEQLAKQSQELSECYQALVSVESFLKDKEGEQWKRFQKEASEIKTQLNETKGGSKQKQKIAHLDRSCKELQAALELARQHTDESRRLIGADRETLSVLTGKKTAQYLRYEKAFNKIKTMKAAIEQEMAQNPQDAEGLRAKAARLKTLMADFALADEELVETKKAYLEDTLDAQILVLRQAAEEQRKRGRSGIVNLIKGVVGLFQGQEKVQVINDTFLAQAQQQLLSLVDIDILQNLLTKDLTENVKALIRSRIERLEDLSLAGAPNGAKEQLGKASEELLAAMSDPKQAFSEDLAARCKAFKVRKEAVYLEVRDEASVKQGQERLRRASIANVEEVKKALGAFVDISKGLKGAKREEKIQQMQKNLLDWFSSQFQGFNPCAFLTHLRNSLSLSMTNVDEVVNVLSQGHSLLERMKQEQPRAQQAMRDLSSKESLVRTAAKGIRAEVTGTLSAQNEALSKLYEHLGIALDAKVVSQVLDEIAKTLQSAESVVAGLFRQLEDKIKTERQEIKARNDAFCGSLPQDERFMAVLGAQSNAETLFALATRNFSDKTSEQIIAEVEAARKAGVGYSDQVKQAIPKLSLQEVLDILGKGQFAQELQGLLEAHKAKCIVQEQAVFGKKLDDFGKTLEQAESELLSHVSQMKQDMSAAKTAKEFLLLNERLQTAYASHAAYRTERADVEVRLKSLTGTNIPGVDLICREVKGKLGQALPSLLRQRLDVAALIKYQHELVQEQRNLVGAYTAVSAAGKKIRQEHNAALHQTIASLQARLDKGDKLSEQEIGGLQKDQQRYQAEEKAVDQREYQAQLHALESVASLEEREKCPGMKRIYERAQASLERRENNCNIDQDLALLGQLKSQYQEMAQAERLLEQQTNLRHLQAQRAELACRGELRAILQKLRSALDSGDTISFSSYQSLSKKASEDLLKLDAAFAEAELLLSLRFSALSGSSAADKYSKAVKEYDALRNGLNAMTFSIASLEDQRKKLAEDRVILEQLEGKIQAFAELHSQNDILRQLGEEVRELVGVSDQKKNAFQELLARVQDGAKVDASQMKTLKELHTSALEDQEKYKESLRAEFAVEKMSNDLMADHLGVCRDEKALVEKILNGVLGSTKGKTAEQVRADIEAARGAAVAYRKALEKCIAGLVLGQVEKAVPVAKGSVRALVEARRVICIQEERSALQTRAQDLAKQLTGGEDVTKAALSLLVQNVSRTDTEEKFQAHARTIEELKAAHAQCLADRRSLQDDIRRFQTDPLLGIQELCRGFLQRSENEAPQSLRKEFVVKVDQIRSQRQKELQEDAAAIAKLRSSLPLSAAQDTIASRAQLAYRERCSRMLDELEASNKAGNRVDFATYRAFAALVDTYRSRIAALSQRVVGLGAKYSQDPEVGRIQGELAEFAFSDDIASDEGKMGELVSQLVHRVAALDEIAKKAEAQQKFSKDADAWYQRNLALSFVSMDGLLRQELEARWKAFVEEKNTGAVDFSTVQKSADIIAQSIKRAAAHHATLSSSKKELDAIALSSKRLKTLHSRIEEALAQFEREMMDQFQAVGKQSALAETDVKTLAEESSQMKQIGQQIVQLKTTAPHVAARSEQLLDEEGVESQSLRSLLHLADKEISLEQSKQFLTSGFANGRTKAKTLRDGLAAGGGAETLVALLKHKVQGAFDLFYDKDTKQKDDSAMRMANVHSMLLVLSEAPVGVSHNTVKFGRSFAEVVKALSVDEQKILQEICDLRWPDKGRAPNQIFDFRKVMGWN